MALVVWEGKFEIVLNYIFSKVCGKEFHALYRINTKNGLTIVPTGFSSDDDENTVISLLRSTPFSLFYQAIRPVSKEMRSLQINHGLTNRENKRNRRLCLRRFIVLNDATELTCKNTFWFLHLWLYRISGYFLLLLTLELVALTTAATTALTHQHPALRTGFRSGFRRSSWIAAAAAVNDAHDVTSQGRDETSRAIQGKIEP